jgi:hypothetical protein
VRNGDASKKKIQIHFFPPTCFSLPLLLTPAVVLLLKPFCFLPRASTKTIFPPLNRLGANIS